MNDHETQRMAPETHHIVFLFLDIGYTMDKVQKEKNVRDNSAFHLGMTVFGFELRLPCYVTKFRFIFVFKGLIYCVSYTSESLAL